MEKQSLVSIIIPTYNSSKSIRVCLESVFRQDYPAMEVIIIDSHSKDDTEKIVQEYKKCSMYVYDGGLLGARILGLQKSSGEYVLFLDSDQVLKKDTLSRCVGECENQRADMVALGEDVYERKTFLQWLFYCDRKVIETVKDLDPMTSAILPRFFRRQLLMKAVQEIPKSIISTVGGPDHAIIYFESYRMSRHVSSIPHAIFHMEPSSIVRIMVKSYRWGKTGVSAKSAKKYALLMKSKERFRKKIFTKGLFLVSIGSMILLLLKGIPYITGYIIGKYSPKKAGL